MTKPCYNGQCRHAAIELMLHWMEMLYCSYVQKYQSNECLAYEHW